MHRIPVSQHDLQSAVQARCPNWREWKELKPLFLDWQHNRCGYCQGDIGGRADPRTADRDLFEQHMEHFRPKGAVAAWVPPPWKNPPPLEIGSPEGYPWLEKDVRNYLASCPTCNSKYKHNYFPVQQRLGDYSHQPAPAELASEGPYLIYPFGDLEPLDPELLISFWGCEAIPHPQWADGTREYWRARVNIDLLGLNRQDLKIRRSKLIVILGLCFFKLGDVCLDDFCDPKAEFSSCARHYRALCLKDRDAALQLAHQLAVHVGLFQHATILRGG